MDAKSAATNFGLQTANIYTIAIGIFLLQFDGSPFLTPHIKSLNFTSLIASVFVQIVALIESYKDFSGKAKSMHRCAVQVNRLFQRLEIDPRLDMGLLAQYQEQYSSIIEDHDVNHDDIDFLTAQIEPSRRRQRSAAEWRSLAWWRVKYTWNVYAFTVTILVLPWLSYVALSWWGIQ